MDDPALNGNAILNAAAVWFVFKAIEVTAFVIYDIGSAITKRIRVRGNHQDDPDPDPATLHELTYESRRGWLEYVLTGVGFLNPSLCRPTKKWLLLASNIVPLAFFALELMSITLGNETITCKTSKDANVVSGPSLVLFGEGIRHTNVNTIMDQVGSDEQLFFRPCVSWISKHFGVDFFSSICVNAIDTADHNGQSAQLNVESQPTALFLPRTYSTGIGEYAIFGEALQCNFSQDPVTQVKEYECSRDRRGVLGTLKFFSEVIVNGKNILTQDAFIADQISEKQRNRLIQDVRITEHRLGLELGIWFEDEDYFGFVWEDIRRYVGGAYAVSFALLAQATREPIKAAVNMSKLNTLSAPYDISCEEDFRLPRTASIIIIGFAVLFRFILIFLPTSKSSVEYALEKSAEEFRQKQRIEESLS